MYASSHGATHVEELCQDELLLTRYDDRSLMWSVAPITSATITEEGSWQDVPDTSVDFVLFESTTVAIAYTLLAEADKDYHPGGDFLNQGGADESGLGDFLGTRLVVDGVPYRQSGSHLSPMTSFEASTGELTGNLYLELAPGNHTATLQWKKWGTFVRSWSNLPVVHGGYGESRSVVVTGFYKHMWFSQATSSDKIYTADVWGPISDMQIDFNLDVASDIRFTYSLTVRPSSAPSVSTHNLVDMLETRLVLDGVAFRESGSSFGTTTAAYRAGSLVGSMVLPVAAGNHTVTLQWKKFGTAVAAWFTQPHFLDGFVSGRSLAAFGVWYTIPVANEGDDRIKLVAANDTTGAPVHQDWQVVSDSTVSMTLLTNSSVEVSYTVNIVRVGDPTFDSWSWDRWTSLAFRLVVDDVPYRIAAARSDALVRIADTLSGNLVVPLAHGTHSAQLQWQVHDGSLDASQFEILKERMDGFGGGRVLVALVNAWNQGPVISAPEEAVLGEDHTLAFGSDVDSFTVVDYDAALVDHARLATNLSVSNGVLSVAESVSLPAASDNDTFVSVAADNRSITALLTPDDTQTLFAELKYTPDLDWFGFDTLRIVVDDLGNSGAGGNVATDANLSLVVEPANDAVTWSSVPGVQVVQEDTATAVGPFYLADVDAVDSNGEVDGLYEVTATVQHGTLSLSNSSNVTDLTFVLGDGQADSTFTVQGSLQSLGEALEWLT